MGTFDGKNKIEKIYVNGILYGNFTITDNANIKISDSPFYLGKSNMENGISDSPLATFSDVLIFDRALSEDEVRDNYNSIPNPVNTDNLLLWYKF